MLYGGDGTETRGHRSALRSIAILDRNGWFERPGSHRGLPFHQRWHAL